MTELTSSSRQLRTFHHPHSPPLTRHTSPKILSLGALNFFVNESASISFIFLVPLYITFYHTILFYKDHEIDTDINVLQLFSPSKNFVVKRVKN
ncbi:hypothetical protein PsorP6_012101 [Peronosclerospora sorghi]|uniref:Uncharacterized protein n=1 Tax=Peronosclerospora sorghi TaxID=230839 RepID=A0ACC0WLG2_9STRA|nr:hypothetical protein PsorP6_012101 [Peronosclerospora sorghi]